MDHAALFKAVKSLDVEQLHQVLGPTLTNFGCYQVVYWDHAYDGILTSLNAFTGTEGYECLRWAEKLVSDSHHKPGTKKSDPDPEHVEYVYKLRAELLGRAAARVADFDPAERPGVWESTASAIAALDEEIAEANLHDAEWHRELQGKVAEAIRAN